MKNLVILFGLAGLIVWCSLISCNTLFWQPVSKLLIGTWVMSPNPSGNETIRWTFETDGCLYQDRYDATTGTFITRDLFFTSPTDRSLTDCIEWNVDAKVTKHYLNTERWFLGDNRDVAKWLVVKINKKELYLSSEIENGDGVTIKGDFQRGFLLE